QARGLLEHQDREPAVASRDRRRDPAQTRADTHQVHLLVPAGRRSGGGGGAGHRGLLRATAGPVAPRSSQRSGVIVNETYCIVMAAAAASGPRGAMVANPQSGSNAGRPRSHEAHRAILRATLEL